jgi:hypothetical protein
LIRDAHYAIDHGDTIFAPQFKAFLKDACAMVFQEGETSAAVAGRILNLPADFPYGRAPAARSRRQHHRSASAICEVAARKKPLMDRFLGPSWLALQSLRPDVRATSIGIKTQHDRPTFPLPMSKA